jgi:hypothetical protein
MYYGNYVAGNREGFGILYYAQGGKYEGNWAKGKKHGPGKMIDFNGNIETGVW